MNDGPPNKTEPGLRFRTPWHCALAIGLWSLIFGIAWLVLAGPDLASWLIGLPAVAGAIWARARLSRPPRGPLSFWGLIRFIPFFFRESIKGGIDVALRVLGPRVRVNPGYLSYRLRLTHPSARVFFADVVALLPGTLAADLQGDVATIHALDRGGDPVQDLLRLEERVAAVFGEGLPAARSRS